MPYKQVTLNITLSMREDDSVEFAVSPNHVLLHPGNADICILHLHIQVEEED